VIIIDEFDNFYSMLLGCTSLKFERKMGYCYIQGYYIDYHIFYVVLGDDKN